MDAKGIIWIVAAVVVVLVLVALAATLMRRRREKDVVQRREHATELRTNVDQHAHELEDARLRAEEERLKAERLRLQAERAHERAHDAETGYLQQAAQHEDRLREADRIDPDTEDARKQG